MTRKIKGTRRENNQKGRNLNIEDNKIAEIFFKHQKEWKRAQKR